MAILLVEDDDDVRQLVREMLRRRGYTVLEASDGLQAISLFDDHWPSIRLLIADVVMPGMSGPDLARILRKSRPEMAVLYISGYLDEQLREHGVSADHPNLLLKPFTQDELIGKVTALTRVCARASASSGVA